MAYLGLAITWLRTRQSDIRALVSLSLAGAQLFQDAPKRDGASSVLVGLLNGLALGFPKGALEEGPEVLGPFV